MFVIIQTYNNTDRVAGFVSTEDNFPSLLNNHIKKLYGNDFQTLENVSLDSLRYDPKYGENIYLVKYSNNIVLVKKYFQLNEGYIYNSKSSKLADLYSWRLMPIDIKVDSNISLVSAVQPRHWNKDPLAPKPEHPKTSKTSSQDIILV